jgi:ankyrin repeat protein
MYSLLQRVAVVSLLISFFSQGCNPAVKLDTSPHTRNLPKVVVGSKHDQANHLSSTKLTVQHDPATMTRACALSLGRPSQLFTTSSGEKISFLQEGGIWQAKLELSCPSLGFSKLVPVMCEHQEDIVTMVYRLAQQRPAIHKHRIHLLLTPWQSQWVFLGKLGLLGGMEASLDSIRLALHEAVKQEDLALVENLLALGADPNSVDTNGSAPMEYAVWRGYLDLVILLLAKGANPNLPTSKNSSYLHLAAMKNYIDIAKVLVEKGAEVNARTEINNTSYTPLDLAINLGDEDMVKLLLRNNANPNRINENGATPLHGAADNGHIGIISLLLAQGANLDAADDDGFTPLHIAVSQNDIVATRLLLAEGANPNITTKDGFMPLHWATENGNLELVNLLVDNDAEVNAVNPDGVSPLYWAVEKKRVSVAKLLLDKGADPNTATENGLTPLHWATENGDLELVNLLLEKGADLNITDYESWTPLHLAADQGHVDIILRLLSHKPDLNIQTNHGESFLHMLVDNSNLTDFKKCFHNLLIVTESIERTQHILLNDLLGVMQDCCLELTNKNTRSILAMMVDYVQGLDLNLKNEEDKTVLDILKLQLGEEADDQAKEEVIKTLKRHQKLGGWMTLHSNKRAARQASITNAYAIQASNFKKPRHQ